MKASDLFVRALENEGVQFVFALPGEENLDLLESLRNSSIKVICTRHEQAAGFMAATIGRLTGKPGVCLATLGPGATNLVTAAAYASLCGMPMVMITGQKPVTHGKQGQFQIIKTVEMMRPLTKFTAQVVDGSRIPGTVREAFRLAMEEKPGAVHIELPEDIAAQQVPGAHPMPVHRVHRPYPDRRALELAAKAIKQAERPLLLVGAAANRNRTSRALAEFVDATGIPFFNTQMGVGVIDERHPLYLGTAALSDKDAVHHAVHKADLIINVGHDVVEKPPFLMGDQGPRVLHINYYSARVDDIYFPDHEVVGDIANTMLALTARLKEHAHSWQIEPFLRVKQAADALIEEQSKQASFPLTPARLVADLRAAMPDDGKVALDNGLYKLWFARNYRAHKPNTLLLDNALATMGAGLPSAIAAKLINPDLKVAAVCGDGGFLMNSQELVTAVSLGLNMVVLILNDNCFGMIKWKQKEALAGNQEPEAYGFGLSLANPDFLQLARSYGAHGHRVNSTEALLPLLKTCLSGEVPGVHVIEVPVEYESTYAQIKVPTLSLQPLESQEQPQEPQDPQAAEEETPQEFLTVLSPHDQSLVGKPPLHTEAELESALKRAHSLYLDQSNWLPPHQRIKILERLVQLMEENQEELVQTAIAEGGKPRIDTEVEVQRAIQGVKLGIVAIHNLHGQEVPMGLTPASTGRLALTVREPIGVVAALSAFNHPLNLAVHQIIPAIAAGCPVIIKPASATPYSCATFVHLLHKAGLPDGFCQCLFLDRQNAEKLATDERVAFLSFIGSPKVGWQLRSKLAPGTRCALEHGGSAPVIIHRSSSHPEKMEELLAPLIKGAFYHAGQVCVSTKRIFVPAEAAQSFAEKLGQGAQRLKVGNPMDAATEVGPMINNREVLRVHEWVQEAIQGGAKLICGGTFSQNYYAPTVLLNPPPQARVSTQEIFGPVVCVYSYNDLTEAIEASNRLPCEFQAAVFSKDLDSAMHIVRRLKASTVMVNDHTAFRTDWMPFAGHRQAGLGTGGIEHAARELSQEKLIVIKSPGLA